MTATEPNALALIVADSGLNGPKGQALTEQFSHFLALADEWQAKAQALVVTDAGQTAEMKMAREGRLFLREKRLSVERMRVALKADALAEGRAIDAVAKVLTGRLEPIEKLLGESETFAVRAKAARDEARKAERTAQLAPFGINPSFYDLVNMPAADFAELLDGLKIALAAQLEAARAAREAERLAAAETERARQAEAAERALARQESDRLRAEAEAREAELAAQLQAERAAAEALRREAAQNAAIEAMRKMQADKKAAREESDRLRAERTAAAAPDKTKLLALAAALAAVELPTLSTPEAREVLADVQRLLGKVDAFIREKAAEL